MDLFLHTVEMISVLSGDNGTLEEKGNAWVSFIVKGECVDCQADIGILDEYFSYFKAIDGYRQLLKGQMEERMTRFLRGEWVVNQQMDAIRVFVTLEMLKGLEEVDVDLKMKFDNCRIFFRNLYRHASVINSPKDSIVHFLRLAKACRKNAMDILNLANDSEIKNPLITTEEKWRLRLLTMRNQNYGADDVRKVLELLDDISEPQILRGEASILFSVAFDGDMEDILKQCAELDFDVLQAKLTRAKEVFCRHFNFDALPETVRKLLLHGEYSIQSGRGVWYPCELGLNKTDWIDTWYSRVRPNASLKVNHKIVRFLRSNGNPPSTNEPVPNYFKLLQFIAASEDAGRKVFSMIWGTPLTQGRFRVIDGWKPEFKGYMSLLWFLSEEFRNGVSHNGINLNIDYSRDENGNIWIDITIPETDGNPRESISIPMRQEGDWEQVELNDIIKTFRSTGTLQLPNHQGDTSNQP